eukprot:IDg12356t1
MTSADIFRTAVAPRSALAHREQQYRAIPTRAAPLLHRPAARRSTLTPHSVCTRAFLGARERVGCRAYRHASRRRGTHACPHARARTSAPK